MSRVVFVADVHLGNHGVHGGPVEAGMNRRCRQVLATVDAAYRQAEEVKAQLVVVLGDLFDNMRPAPQLIAAVQLRMEVAQKAGVTTLLLLGNHEMESTAEGDHALGPLRAYAKVFEAPGKGWWNQGWELWLVPFQPGPAEEWLPKVLATFPEKKEKLRLLGLHLGVSDGKTPPWLLGAHDSIPAEKLADLCEKHGFDFVFAGNWHEPRVWEFSFKKAVRRVYQVGTLCPTGWDNPGLGYGSLVTLDTEKRVAAHAVVPGPRFVKSEEDAEKALVKGCIPYLRLPAQPEQMAAAHGVLAGLAKKGVIGEVVLDTAETQAALRTAMGVARDADDVDEAVAAFIGQMPIAAEGMRPEVVARVKKFLGGA